MPFGWGQAFWHFHNLRGGSLLKLPQIGDRNDLCMKTHRSYSSKSGLYPRKYYKNASFFGICDVLSDRLHGEIAAVHLNNLNFILVYPVMHIIQSTLYGDFRPFNPQRELQIWTLLTISFIPSTHINMCVHLQLYTLTFVEYIKITPKLTAYCSTK